MSLNEAIYEICRLVGVPITPQDLREKIKTEYPQYYQTPSHLRNVEKGHYQDADHALLANIYIVVNSNKRLTCDKSFKPMRISIAEDNIVEHASAAPSRLKFKSIHQPRHLDYSEKVRDVLNNIEKYHDAYYQAEVFSGPSLYFHKQAIANNNEITVSQETLNNIYAVLTSWGMHRSGKGGAKMQDFAVFKESMASLAGEIATAKEYNLNDMDEHKWEVVKKIFEEINVMASGTHLVGNSKVMHHIMPNLIPPIDREYTLWYLRGNTNIENNIQIEWSLMKEIISNFFQPIIFDDGFQLLAANWQSQQEKYPWDTSTMKIVDNLVIGAKKSKLK
jgi:hypothetical protein